jgi:hypothetical protein
MHRFQNLTTKNLSPDDIYPNTSAVGRVVCRTMFERIIPPISLLTLLFRWICPLRSATAVLREKRCHRPRALRQAQDELREWDPVPQGRFAVPEGCFAIQIPVAVSNREAVM